MSLVGSYALVGTKVPEDSTVVAKLRQSGAIILGKTSLSEWYNLRSTNSSDGWNARGGQTYGAYYPEQDPSGSSSGSAVSADLGLALAALGTEVSHGWSFSQIYTARPNLVLDKTNGSILLPSEKNNIVGIKPTVGLTSRHMVIPVSSHEDSIGPLARTVKDAAKILQAIVSQDPKDNYTMASPYALGFPDYVAACQVSGLQDKRIGIPTNVIDHLSGPERDVIGSAFRKAVSDISAAGATIVDKTNFTAYDESLTSQVPSAVTGSNFVSNIARYLANLESNPNNIHSLADIRRFTQHAQPFLEEYPSRNTILWDIIASIGLNSTSPEYWPMYQQTLKIGGEGGILGAIERHNLDAVILPTILAPSIPSMVGTPVITVPLGAWPEGTEVSWDSRGDVVERAPGVPFGISFLGKKWSEEGLIGMAYAFEQRTKVREGTRGRYIAPRMEIGDV